MRVTLSDTARQFIALFEDVTGATARDCLVHEKEGGKNGRVTFLVAAGEMGQAIGPGGRRVKQVEEKLGREVTLVEDADTAEAFVANALAPAVVTHVTVSEQNDRVAYVEVDSEDRGVAIGTEGKNIKTARELARRHWDLDDVQLT
ncbi:NusA-like transcription termination signal-binding factor [Salinigranum rubrum]|uniref:Probable transcription termination protein NusA n=1 Tax=Salinigranum rubrum TaxID=755307 RepID=A0A2I8VF94_9EURY|nr:NusA-like transcription termination signal-binding factor [Salinigranum rubrum]AUV80596.1 NusA-like transcription termination signal-binding factor [Salinigranum rubrum]